MFSGGSKGNIGKKRVNYGQSVFSLNDVCEVKLCFYVGFSFGEMKQKK